MPIHPRTERQKKMGETPIILLPVVAPEPHIKQNRTPSDFVIVAIFHDKRKPPAGRPSPFAADFTAIKA
jgi:hypothetical protein